MVTALKASPMSYQPPNSKRLKGPILESRYNDAQKKLQGFSGTNVTLCSDGWSTLDEKKIINFVIGNSENVCFVKSIDCSGEVTSSDFIFEKIKEVIENLAAKEITVVAVSTDTAANMKAAMKKLSRKFSERFDMKHKNALRKKRKGNTSIKRVTYTIYVIVNIFYQNIFLKYLKIY